MQQIIEDHALAIQRPYWRALGYDVEQQGDGTFQLVEREGGPAKDRTTFKGEFFYGGDDLGAMQEAADKLQDRAYGTPTRITELSGPDGDPIQVEGRDLQQALAKLPVEERRTVLAILSKAGE